MGVGYLHGGGQLPYGQLHTPGLSIARTHTNTKNGLSACGGKSGYKANRPLPLGILLFPLLTLIFMRWPYRWEDMFLIM